MDRRGFLQGLFGVADPAATARVLSEVFGWREAAREGARTRFSAGGAAALGGSVDLLALPGARGHQGRGSVHHVAFRAADDAAQAAMAAGLGALNLPVTEQKDRFYFRSVYFREPGHVLFEIATDAPGFTADEPLAALVSQLRLPPHYEPIRARIEAALPPL